MGFSNNLDGAALTVALPLGLLAAVVLWGFFERRPGSRFAVIPNAAGPQPVGRPEIEVVDPGVQPDGGPGEAGGS